MKRPPRSPVAHWRRWLPVMPLLFGAACGGPQTLGDGGTESEPASRNPHAGRVGKLDPTVFLFDAVPAGVGLAERIFERAVDLTSRAKDLIARCPCHGGCPA